MGYYLNKNVWMEMNCSVQEEEEEVEQEVFDDVHLSLVILFLFMLQLLHYIIRDPCTC